ncbi:cyclic-phosphate processing receiver domain-containing protein [Virgibacillus proomii]|uniref:cyclic-phosphate processing receiver domain-containing protein n=1 Tax=Virgibacillus proomii TaxID=84407 RepID=UPI0009872352|nr:cyclic-phosphate processing receiver domain-containing protein [Virgibacillus proomii]
MAQHLSDDLRDIPIGFKGARTIEHAISIMEQNTVHMLSLDHDLGVDEEGDLLPTGYDLVKYMCENGLRANRIYIHTDNVVGRENMYQTLLAARRRGFIDNDIEIYRYSITVNRYTES